MARRGSFSATFNGVRHLLFALGVLSLIGTESEASSDVRAFAWMCVVIGFPAPLLVLPFRFVAWLLRLFGIGKRKPQAAQPKQTRAETEQARSPESPASAFFRFTIGERYVLDNGCVLECLGIRGKRERRAGFYDYGWLEYYPNRRSLDADYYEWHAIRTDGSAEVCDRGRIRADRVASSEQSAEWAEEVKSRFDGERAYWAERKAKRERDEKRLAELEKLVKEKGWK